MVHAMSDKRSFLGTLIGDGRPLLALTAVCLVLSGMFALFLSITRHFLPHDVQFLGMTPQQLCAINQCRIVHFMIHDRVSFGGVLIAIGTLYMWLCEYPMRQHSTWAWWLFVVSGLAGFGSFLSYLGYGYLDTWHGIATLGLLPCFVAGLFKTHKSCAASDWRVGLRSSVRIAWRTSRGLGRACLLAAAVGLIAGGATIMTVGMTCVFVPQDLAYLGLNTNELRAINPRLVPLIAHDRAGFGGGVLTYGLLMLGCIWYGEPSRSLWQALGLSGTIGFATAIGVHPVIGYVDFIHLAPAVAGAAIFALGLGLSCRSTN